MQQRKALQRVLRLIISILRHRLQQLRHLQMAVQYLKASSFHSRLLQKVHIFFTDSRLLKSLQMMKRVKKLIRPMTQQEQIRQLQKLQKQQRLQQKQQRQHQKQQKRQQRQLMQLRQKSTTTGDFIQDPSSLRIFLARCR